MPDTLAAPTASNANGSHHGSAMELHRVSSAGGRSPVSPYDDDEGNSPNGGLREVRL